MGNDYHVPAVVKLLPPLPHLQPVTPTVITPLEFEPDESYFLGLQEAVYRLLEGYTLPQNRRGRRVLYGIREIHSQNDIGYASDIEDSILEGEYTMIIPELRERQIELLERAAITEIYQKYILQLLKPDVLYHEGVPPMTYLEGIATHVYYLDEGSKNYYEIVDNAGKEVELQKRREKEDWLTKISGSIWQFRRPLMIVGCDHLENKFRLVDLLSDKGIDLHILNPRQE